MTLEWAPYGASHPGQNDLSVDTARCESQAKMILELAPRGANGPEGPLSEHRTVRITRAKMTLAWAPHGANHTAVGRKFLPTDVYQGAQACLSPRCRRSMCGSAHVSLSGHRTVRITQRWAESFCQPRSALPAPMIPCHGMRPRRRQRP